MKALLRIFLLKSFESVIEIIADKNVKLKGWHVEISRDRMERIESVCLTRKS